MTNLDRKLALAVAQKMAELADWDLPERRVKDARHRQIVELAAANPKEFAANGGGMEKE